MRPSLLIEALQRVMVKAVGLVRVPTSRARKASQDYVTDVDLAVDAYLQKALTALLPGVPVLSEERAAELQEHVPAYWIVDPIDGTLNLIAGLPFVGISVALADKDGPNLAAVASLMDGTILMAARGQGAWSSGPGRQLQRLHLAPEAPVELVVLSSGLMDILIAEGVERWGALRRVGKIRNLGAQALHLCGVATGTFAAACSIEARVWDEAAGGLILREAGGVWASTADAADWRKPAQLMAITNQRSLACHPSVVRALSNALHGLVTPVPGVE